MKNLNVNKKWQRIFEFTQLCRRKPGKNTRSGFCNFRVSLPQLIHQSRSTLSILFRQGFFFFFFKIEKVRGKVLNFKVWKIKFYFYQVNEWIYKMAGRFCQRSNHSEIINPERQNVITGWNRKHGKTIKCSSLSYYTPFSFFPETNILQWQNK